MAKKRTLKPFYGKLNQRIEQRAQALMKAGDVDNANLLFAQSANILQMRSTKSRRTRS